MTIRLLAWNVNHRAARHAIPRCIVDEILEATPDVLLLSEYVVGQDHDRFCSDLKNEADLTVSLSPQGYGNQFLLATKGGHKPGSIVGPNDIPWVPGNLQHAKLNGSGVNIIGFRMPAFEKKERHFKRPTWNWLRQQLSTVAALPIIIAGDFNTAVGDSAQNCGDCIAMLEADGWTQVIPTSGYSWCRRAGIAERRIDYAFASRLLVVSSCEYSWDFRDKHGVTSQAPGTPDHAMLNIVFENVSQISAS